ncbi:hypothetical protein F3Y22_tig00111372pilonHSYRG00187 [Hibiscus syriacus]|uniref:Reverse transcriptase zinc-binding domain-containing protein n=1 Tax=Hibiscus syriacus TaxID=106335 RepID=A0A6A2YN11_HIBSY|nr:hypothetical protein F3Y22_tig00111372pilonHSYRG00187 [Hibiscus syriacus]
MSVSGWNKACFARLVRSLLAEDGSLWVAWIHSYMIKYADFWQMSHETDLGKHADHKACIRLARMGLAIENDNCLLCSTEPETRDHIFFECGLAKTLWGAIISLCGIHRTVSCWNGELAWATHCFKGKSLIVRMLKLALAGYVYSIWKERNNRLFGGKVRLMEDILDDTRDAVRARLSSWSINIMESRNVALCDSWGILCI